MAVSSHPNLTQELRDQVMNSLLQRSEGMFQWVALLIRTLPQITEDIPDWLKSLPRGLPEAYTRVFDEIEVLGGSKPKIAQRTFDWMIGCFEPLHQDALVEFARRNPNGDGVEYSSLTIDIVLDAYRNLLVVDPGTSHFGLHT
ncbi:hypothetical protein N7455_003449 [Penicillium solitum]|uniref:uncharacterized protein n=1 Tax=Penicillium solitum TaxID=60172 RepID=UPI001857485D|nr:hypothetical protein HAV15_005259 [Penicillium sp. str. \